MKNKGLVILLAVFFIFNVLLAINNQDCPFHVDYVQYTKSIQNFYEHSVIDSNVNGKFLFIYLMAVLITPFKLLNLNLYGGLIFIIGLFQIFLIYLFHQYTKSFLKTLLMSTTLTFMTFLGHAETAIISSVFLMLFFINREKPYAEFFIMIATFIRLDSMIYYVFGKKRQIIIPVCISLLQWLSGSLYYVHSDFGFNYYALNTFFIFIFSFGAYIAFFFFATPKKKNLDYAIHLILTLALIFFLKFPSQKVFFFSVILFFILYEIKPFPAWALVSLTLINVSIGIYIQSERSNLCTPKSIAEFATPSTFMGTFSPYMDFYNKTPSEPYNTSLSLNCNNTSKYVEAEDWRNAQLLFIKKKFCLIPYKN